MLLPAAPDERFGYISQVWGLQLMLHTHNYLFYLDLDVLDEDNVAEVVEVAGVTGEEEEPPTEEEDGGGGRGRGFASGFGISMNRRRLQYELDDEMEEGSGGGGRPVESAKTSRLRRHRICKGKTINKPCLEVINTASLPSMFSEETTRSYAWVR
ncbi:unnamed protein product [Dibothriocephalus latus]|uniref:Uncharacterized protein n=1 Tax=Dibothriocephalus latus TaxID=60516 RepID=A0A3P6QBC8_DIBLA|nr:unnamed protein product [Dibothriocephalus latus]